MLNRLLRRLFKRKAAPQDNTEGRAPGYDTDPLDPMARMGRRRGWQVEAERPNPFKISAADFPLAELEGSGGHKLVSPNGRKFAVDSIAKAVRRSFAMHAMDTAAMDDGEGSQPISSALANAYTVPEALINWYISQGFIGYQACALIAQNWLVNKACTMAGEDSIRNGWKMKARGAEQKLQEEDHDTLLEYDLKFKLKENMVEMHRFKNIFGIRVVLFVVESDDPDYYEKPFNIDGVTEGSYKGLSQIDPYWMMPMMTAEATADPSSMHFYEPEYWIISGKKYHRTHLVIDRGPQPADILKPTYIFGGIPMVQQIYERVYAAERTANEAPLLAMNKRTTAIHVDTDKAIANEDSFFQRLQFWVKYRDNHAVKILGKEEAMEQFDTSLSDFDSVIMNQYQLVAAIAKVPATKLLGTSPKGFNATGEFETISYHEYLESIQEHEMMPLISRHYELLVKSLGLELQIEVVFEPVASLTAQQQADLNKTKAETGNQLINSGAIAPDEERRRVRDDNRSGYNTLTEDEANQEQGMSPENLAAFQKAGAAQTTAAARTTVAGAESEEVAKGGAKGSEGPRLDVNEDEEDEAPGRAVVASRPAGDPPAVPSQSQDPAAPVQPEKGITAPSRPNDPDPSVAAMQAMTTALATIVRLLDRLDDRGVHEGADIGQMDASGRSVTPGVRPAASPSVSAVHVGEKPAYQLPKMRVNGLMLRIENPRGTVRSGIGEDGNTWSINMPHHYGYISGVKGADGDEMDCFVGPNLKSQKAFIVNQNDREGTFDEHKCMLGFDSVEQANEAYHAAYRPGWDGMGSIHEVSMDGFRDWLTSSATTGPYTDEWAKQAGYAPMTA
ncbi:minor head protein-like protein [Burkholderia phage vB_BglM_WTB]